MSSNRILLVEEPAIYRPMPVLYTTNKHKGACDLCENHQLLFELIVDGESLWLCEYCISDVMSSSGSK